MRLIKAESPKDIDMIVPFIKALYEGTVMGKHVSLAGYLAWLVAQLPREDFNIWISINEEGAATGFAVVERVIRLFQYECHIHDSYTAHVDMEFSEQFFESVESWARDMQCQTISCYTNRPEALSRRFGFEQAGTLLIKAV